MNWEQHSDGDLTRYHAAAASTEWRKLGFELKDFWTKLAHATAQHCAETKWNRLAVEMWATDGVVRGYPYKRGLQEPLGCLVSIEIPLVLAEADALDAEDPSYDYKINCIHAKLRGELTTGKNKAREALIELGAKTDFTIWLQELGDREGALEIEVF